VRTITEFQFDEAVRFWIEYYKSKSKSTVTALDAMLARYDQSIEECNLSYCFHYNGERRCCSLHSCYYDDCDGLIADVYPELYGRYTKGSPDFADDNTDKIDDETLEAELWDG
jgi:hypothetical protein